jgi:XrtJ-associated TM-motif-TM protein
VPDARCGSKGRTFSALENKAQVLEMSMKKGVLSALVVAGILTASASAWGQSGCVDSPENPTAVLAILGAASAMISHARGVAKRRREQPRGSLKRAQEPSSSSVKSYSFSN